MIPTNIGVKSTLRLLRHLSSLRLSACALDVELLTLLRQALGADSSDALAQTLGGFNLWVNDG